MDDTPAINDGADTSLRKTVSLLNKIEAKTGSTTITGPVTVNNEVEVKNDSGNPVPVGDAGGSLTVDGSVSVSNLPASYPVTDNGGSLTVDGTVTANLDPNSPVIASQIETGIAAYAADLANDPLPVIATQSSASNLKTQAQLIDSSGTVYDYVQGGVAGTPSADVITVQGVSGGTQVPVSGTVTVGNVAGFNIPTHDYRSFGYTSGNLTSITYKTGGAGGTTVATLTLAYDGSGNLVSMTKT